MTPATILLRQVHPTFAPDGELTSQAFFPFPKDDGKLSVYDGDLITAPDSHKHYTSVLKYESVGVWGVSQQEVSEIGLESIASWREDSPAHAHIDFEDRDEKTCRKLAKKLKAAALTRGCLFAP